MKTLIYPFFIVCLLMLAGCADDDNTPGKDPDTPSAVDTKPFYLEKYIDDSVHPGDNMFYYSYGKWLASATPGASFYDFEGVAEAKKARITNTPESDCFTRLYNEYMAAAKEGRTFEADVRISEDIVRKSEELNDATTEDEVVRVWADCVKEGYYPADFIGLGCCEDGICVTPSLEYVVTVLKMAMNNAASRSEEAQGIRCRVIDKLMTELGIKTNLVYYDTTNNLNEIAMLDRMTLDELKDAIKISLKQTNNLMGPSFYGEEFAQSIFEANKLYARFHDLCEYNPVGLFATQEENDAVIRLVTELKEVLIERIYDLDWMSSTTKSKAAEKVENIVPVVVGAIDTRGQKLFASIQAETMCSSYVKMNKALLSVAKEMVGKPRTETNMYYVMEYENINRHDSNTRETVNAFYYITTNCICICPPFGSAPVVDLMQTDAILYGGMGFVVGHELTHSIDKQGSIFNKYGIVENWWTDNDYQTFTERTQAVVNSYGSMDALPSFFPNIKNNSARTRDENIADIGGCEIALTAYKRYLTRQGFKGEEMDKCLRKCFIALNTFLLKKIDQEEAIQLIARDDVHSMEQTRMGGMCRNCDEWYRLFNVEPRHKLYLAPERRCKIW